MGSKTATIFPIVATAILAATAITGGIVTGANNAQLDAQRTQLGALTDQIATASASTSDLEQGIALQGKGASPERVAADTESIERLVKGAMTWDSHASYGEARDKVMREHNLKEDSSFIESFLPEAPVNRDSLGNEYPYIDAAGLNSQVGGMTVSVLSVDGVEYEYMVLVDVQSTSSDGRATATDVATVFVTVDGAGDLSDIAGYASTSAPVTSD